MKNKNQKLNKTILSAIASLLIVLSISNTALASEITPENIEYLINKERILHGLQPLKVDNDLSHAATLKSHDMLNRNYFEHFALGLTPWDFINNSGYRYQSAGENLAMNFETSEGVVSAWLNSSAHRANILNPNFEDIGVGVVKGVYTEAENNTHETIMITNMFGHKKSVIFDYFNKIIENFRSLFGF